MRTLFRWFQHSKQALLNIRPLQKLFYRTLPIVQLPWYIRAFGVKCGLKSTLAVSVKRGMEPLEIRGLKGPVLVRPGTSDVQIFFEVFVHRDYDVPIEREIVFIVDGGAHAGYVSLFFANKHPSAKILAIEPEESNYKMLTQNLRDYPNVKPMKGAIWHRRAPLRIRNLKKDDKCRFQVEETSNPESGPEAILIDELLKSSGHDAIDILKLDIEGAEKDLFANNPEKWLGSVNVLMVELHDTLKEGCSEAFEQAIAHQPFQKFLVRRFLSGQNVILMRQKAKSKKLKPIPCLLPANNKKINHQPGKTDGPEEGFNRLLEGDCKKRAEDKSL